MHLLDTSVAIALRDDDADVTERFAELPSPVGLSIITRIELEGGAADDTFDGRARRDRLNPLLSAFHVLDFDAEAADAYRMIVRNAGFSRRKTMDRMIAAQALAVGAILITRNGADFRDIPNLKLLEW